MSPDQVLLFGLREAGLNHLHGLCRHFDSDHLNSSEPTWLQSSPPSLPPPTLWPVFPIVPEAWLRQESFLSSFLILLPSSPYLQPNNTFKDHPTQTRSQSRTDILLVIPFPIPKVVPSLTKNISPFLSASFSTCFHIPSFCSSSDHSCSSHPPLICRHVKDFFSYGPGPHMHFVSSSLGTPQRRWCLVAKSYSRELFFPLILLMEPP